QVAFSTLPLRFEGNLGQTDGTVQFISRGPGYTLWITATEAVLALRSAAEKNGASQTVLRMRLEGSNPAPLVSGLEPLPGKANYFLGNDPEQWRTNVPTYAKVKYEQVYSGVDLIYYGSQRQLEYDFVVAPEANPQAIGLSFEGADALAVDAHGD